MFRALTIAGSDCSGGAGIQADLKSFSANGVFGMSVITAITAQNTQGVFGIQDINEDMIRDQIRVIFDDIRVDAIKIGMVSKIESIKAIGQALKEISDIPQIVLDPVMVSKSGFKLLSDNAKETLIKELFPIATLITPNLPEAEEILGVSIKTLDKMKDDATDLLYDGENFIYYKQERIDNKNTHGTGCTLSSAIAANLAKGMNIKDAVKEGKRYVTVAIEHGIELGNGVGPTNHFYELYKLANIE